MKILGLSYENDRRMMKALLFEMNNATNSTMLLEGAVSQVSKFEINPEDNVFTIEPALINFYKLHNKPENKYIKFKSKLIDIEKKYLSGRKTLRQLIRTAPYFTEDHHSRKPYYNIPRDDDVRLLYIYCLLEYFIDVVSKFSPDLILCFNGNYLYKQFASEYARVHKIKFICISTSRIEGYLNILGNDYQAFVIPRSSISLKNLNKAATYLEKANKNSESIVYKGIFNEAAELTTSPRSARINGYLLNYFSYLRFMLFYNIRKTKTVRKKTKQYKIFNSNAWLVFINRSLILFRSLFLLYKEGAIFISPRDFDRFQTQFREGDNVRIFYIPLHVLPESATLSQSNFYFEEDLIRLLSDKLPIDSYIFVKENPLMIGERDLGFYKRIQKLGNVKLISPSVKGSDIMSISSGVVGLSGTALLEGLMLKKPVLVVGQPEFLCLVNDKYVGLDKIDYFIRDVLDTCYLFNDNIREYIASILELNIEIKEGDLNRIYLGGESKDMQRIAKSVKLGVEKFLEV